MPFCVGHFVVSLRICVELNLLLGKALTKLTSAAFSIAKRDTLSGALAGGILIFNLVFEFGRIKGAFPFTVLCLAPRSFPVQSRVQASNEAAARTSLGFVIGHQTSGQLVNLAFRISESC